MLSSFSILIFAQPCPLPARPQLWAQSVYEAPTACSALAELAEFVLCSYHRINRLHRALFCSWETLTKCSFLSHHHSPSSFSCTALCQVCSLPAPFCSVNGSHGVSFGGSFLFLSEVPHGSSPGPFSLHTSPAASHRVDSHSSEQLLLSQENILSPAFNIS